MNLHTAQLVDGGFQLGDAVVRPPRSVMGAARAEGAEPVTLRFRPESLRLAGARKGDIAVTFNMVEELGSDAFGCCTLASRDPARGNVDIIVRLGPRATPTADEVIHLQVERGEQHISSPRSGHRIAA